jgi:hypothetical protein
MQGYNSKSNTKTMQTKLILSVLTFFCTIFSSFNDLRAQEVAEIIQAYPKIEKSQHLSVQWLAFTYHPGGGSLPQSYPNRLDSKGTYILHGGLVANYDYQLKKNVYLRGTLAAYRDCANFKSALAHVAIHWTFLRLGRHSFSGGVGPAFFIREDWHKIDGYKGKDFFGDRVYNGWQYRFFPAGGELEYRYKISNRWDFQYSVIPGYPTLITSKLGVRWRM